MESVKHNKQGKLLVQVDIANQEELLKDIEEAGTAIEKVIQVGVLFPQELPSLDEMQRRLGNYYIQNIRLRFT